MGKEPSCCALMLDVSAASSFLCSSDKRGKLYPTPVDVERSNGVAEGMKMNEDHEEIDDERTTVGSKLFGSSRCMEGVWYISPGLQAY